MSDDGGLKEKSHIQAAAVQEILPFAQGSIQMACVLVANLMIINAGGLLVFPAYIGAAASSLPLSSLMIVNSATAFVAGLLLAALCGYVAYLNYQFNINTRLLSSYLEIVEISEKNDYETRHRLLKWRTETKSSLEKKIKNSDSKITVTFWLGQIFGWGAIIAFVIGCYFARIVMLPN